MIIKVCGMNDQDNLMAIEPFMPDYFGFIFYHKSSRSVTFDDMPELEKVKKIGVFVDEDINYIIEKQKQFQLDAVQLHGDEDEAYISKLKMKLPENIEYFKAISIINEKDFLKIDNYENLVDLIILDTKTKLRGGSGQQFDWSLLEYYSSELPFLLSGGIRADDVQIIKELYNKHDKMKGVDINSKFEIEPGLKNIDLVNKFITNLKN